MSYRPTIGIPTQTLHAIDGIPPGLPHSWVMNQRYYYAAIGAGAVPWMVPLVDDDLDTLRAIYDRLDGVFLAGGVDLDPATYGAEPHPKLGNTDPARDTVELALARWALEEDKPLLGLCRGLQVINVALGGSLHQDLEAECPDFIKHDYFPNAGYERDHLAHEVQLVSGSRLAATFRTPRVTVNSMHHQGIKDLGTDLVATAFAPDGLVEAIELADRGFVVGVQWHPEMLEERDPRTRQLFREFAAAASQFAGH
ncbi:MAG: gamma-glutamyl-gamma-aminobutyrate hydrolase family protein [Gemmatimonadetes bacterium]|nr:gamma-glutamyl-gamma-aminobutyrate hydrolase family protein [Gemmatimonadota bacterium]